MRRTRPGLRDSIFLLMASVSGGIAGGGTLGGVIGFLLFWPGSAFLLLSGEATFDAGAFVVYAIGFPVGTAIVGGIAGAAVGFVVGFSYLIFPHRLSGVLSGGALGIFVACFPYNDVAIEWFFLFSLAISGIIGAAAGYAMVLVLVRIDERAKHPEEI